MGSDTYDFFDTNFLSVNPKEFVDSIGVESTPENSTEKVNCEFCKSLNPQLFSNIPLKFLLIITSISD